MVSFLDGIECYLENHKKIVKFGSILLIAYFLAILFAITLGLLTISLASCFHFFVLLGIFIPSGIIPVILDFLKIKKSVFADKFPGILKNYPVIQKFFKSFRFFCVFIITVSLIFYILGENTKVIADNIVQQYYSPFVVELGNKVKSLVSEQTETTARNQDIVKEVKQNDDFDYQAIRFKIVNPNAEFNVEQFKNKFFHSPGSALSEARLGLYLSENVYDVFASCDPVKNGDYDTELNKIALLETDFSRRIELAALNKENDVLKWYNMLPTSDDLDEIINLREDLIKRGYRCYTIFNRLSNDYQEYALEFYSLNVNPDAILYYYCKSIEADMLALSYATSVKEMNTCLKRIQMRYQDIYSCKIIDEETREIAKSVSIQIAIDCGFDYSTIG